MGTSSLQLREGSTAKPDAVPFIGWSRAAHEFRLKVAEFAPGGDVCPLIIGDPGVGKKTMARAWQHVVGPDVKMPIEILEERSVKLPERFIGLTVCRPQRGRYCFLLGYGRRGEVPEPNPRSIRLDDEMMQRFELPLYMPPIHADRPVDVLAFLDYWNRVRSPLVGIRYKAIEVSLLYRMLFGREWDSNLEGIYRYLRIVNHLNRPGPTEHADEEPEDAASEPPTHLETLSDRGAADPVESSDALDRGTAANSGTETDHRVIPFSMLPDIAVRIYLWLCQHDPIEEVCRKTPEQVSDTKAIRALLDSLEMDLTARSFLKLTEEQFVRDHVLPGLEPSLARRSDCLAICEDRVRDQQFFGTDFRSLQAGLRIDPELVGLAVDRRTGGSEGKNDKSARIAIYPGQGSLCSFSVVDEREWANFFRLEGKMLSISFRTPDGRIEEDEFPQDRNSGMVYYRHLLMNPERGFSDLELESASGRKGTSPESAKKQLCEWDDIQGGKGFDAVLDDRAKRETADRLAAIARELAVAERKRDRVAIARLEEERSQLTRSYERAVQNPRERELVELQRQLKKLNEEIEDAKSDPDHLVKEELESERQKLESRVKTIVQIGTDKNLNKEAKRANDRVRKALGEARTKLALGELPQFAHYLDREVQHKNGAWVYRPSKSSPSWLT